MQYKNITKGRGDDGWTDMTLGGSMRKDDPRAEAVGELDSFHASLGMAHQLLPESDRKMLLDIQRNLTTLMGEIPCLEENKERYIKQYGGITDEHVEYLNEIKDALATELDEATGGQSDWSLYGEGGFLSAVLSKASTDLRRAERRLIALSSYNFSVRKPILSYINRLDKIIYLMSKKYEEKN